MKGKQTKEFRIVYKTIPQTFVFKITISHLSAWLEIRVCEWSRSLEELLYMVPATFPVSIVPTPTINSHSAQNIEIQLQKPVGKTEHMHAKQFLCT